MGSIILKSEDVGLVCACNEKVVRIVLTIVDLGLLRGDVSWEVDGLQTLIAEGAAIVVNVEEQHVDVVVDCCCDACVVLVSTTIDRIDRVEEPLICEVGRWKNNLDIALVGASILSERHNLQFLVPGPANREPIPLIACNRAGSTSLLARRTSNSLSHLATLGPIV